MPLDQLIAVIVIIIIMSYALYRISKMDSELEKKLK